MAQPGVNVDGDELIQAIADDLSPAFIEYGRTGLHVPFPGADIGTGNDALQTLALAL